MRSGPVRSRRGLHHWLEDFFRIHPFNDGNGRVGRLFLEALVHNESQRYRMTALGKGRTYRRALEYAHRHSPRSLDVLKKPGHGNPSVYLARWIGTHLEILDDTSAITLSCSLEAPNEVQSEQPGAVCHVRDGELRHYLERRAGSGRPYLQRHPTCGSRELGIPADDLQPTRYNPPMKRILASLTHDPTARLSVGGRTLDLSGLSEAQHSRLARLTAPLLVEVDVTDENSMRAVGIGGVQPHPRVEALRAVQDGRFDRARKALDRLGDEVNDDPELLLARLQSHREYGHDGEADFARLLSLPATTMEHVIAAYRCRAASADTGARAVAAIFARQPERLLAMRSWVPIDAWPREALLSGLERARAQKPKDMELLSEFVTVIEQRYADEPALEAASTELADLRARRRKQTKNSARAILATRPDFAEVEAAFGSPLPVHLRSAWENDYASPTLDFYLVKKDGIAKLQRAARRLTYDFPAYPRILPFARGEHEGDFFALDLSRPLPEGDYPVVLFAAGDAQVCYPSSAAWIAAGGIPRY